MKIAFFGDEPGATILVSVFFIKTVFHSRRVEQDI